MNLFTARTNAVPAAILTIFTLLGLTVKAAPQSRKQHILDNGPGAIKTQRGSIYVLKNAGVQFELPEGWNAQVDKDESVVVSLDSGAVSVTFVVDDDYASVITGMKEGLAQELTQIQSVGEPRQYSLNGISRTSESGRGLLKGNSINWSIDVLKTRKAVTIFTFGVAKVMEEHGDDYAKLVGSLKRI